jgi:transposase-like protein
VSYFFRRIVNCPKCFAKTRQIKDGRTAAASQRFRCKHCGCRYTPLPKDQGYDEEIRLQALTLHLEGLSLRLIGRLLLVNHQTVANWINGYASYLPADLPPSILEMAALDGDLQDILALDEE